jgi:hypothetical protein
MSYSTRTATESSNPELDALRKRAARRKSPWNLLLLALAVLGVGSSWIFLAMLFGEYRRALVPADAFLSSGTRFGNILMHVLPGFPSIAIGLIAANLIIWCIRPARTTLEHEDKEFPGTDFRSSNQGLLKLLIPVAIVALTLAFLGARNFWFLTSQGATYQPMLSSHAKQFNWPDVRSIRTGCYVRRVIEHNFVLSFQDGTSIDLAQETPREFLEAYPTLQQRLTGTNYEFSNSEAIGHCPLSTRWTRVLMEPPTLASH